MAKVKEDISRVRLLVDGKQGINELGKLEMQAKELKVDFKNIQNEQSKWMKESKNLQKIQGEFDALIARARTLKEEGKQSTKTYQNLQERIRKKALALKQAQNAAEKVADAERKLVEEGKKIDQVKTRIDGLRKELGLSGMTLGQLIRYQKELNRELVYGTINGTQRYKELKAELNQVSGVIRSQRAELNGTKGFFAGLGKEIKQFGLLALGYLGANAFFTQVQSLIQGSAKLSDELADVQKTTGLTDQELQKLSQTLNSINTRTPRSELRGLAEIAGRLGIKGVKDIEGFVSAADKINVALGDVLGDPEKVMRELGKLTETFGVRQEFGIEGALLKVGSAINELGMASTANEGYLVEFTKRMGGVAPLANITIQEILGLGATLDSLGQTSEVSSTALSKLFLNMAKNAEVFARQAKMEYNDFVKLLNTDANEAFIKVLEGVKGNSEGLTQLAATLGDVGADGGRVIGVLGTLANNTERLREQQRIANDAFREGTSVVNEFNLKNENMAANLAKVQKWLAGLFVNQSIMKGLNSFVGLWAKWIEIPVSRKMEQERIEMNKLYAQIITTNEGSSERIRLINELKSNYPDLLKNINAETVSNQELSLAVKSVNEQLVNKIILQKQDQKIEEQNQVIAERKQKVFEREDQLRAQAIKLSEKYNFELKEGVSTMEQLTDASLKAEEAQGKMGQMLRGRLFNDVANFKQGISQLAISYENLNTAESFGNRMLDEKNKLIERLGINLKENQGSSSGFKIDPDDPDAPEIITTPAPDNAALNAALETAKKAWEDYLGKVGKIRSDFELSQMDSEQRDLERTREKFAELELELASHLEKKTITKEEFDLREKELEELKQQELDAINLRYKEEREVKREEDLQRLEEATMSERELAELKINQHYDTLLELARQYGVDETEIHALRLKALEDLATKHRQKELQDEMAKYDAKKEMIMSFASVATGVMGLVANFSGETAKYDRTMAIAKAAISSGEAIANMIKMFSATSLTPIDLAAKIAAGTGIILTNINSALRTVNRTNIPDAPETPNVTTPPTRGRVSTPPRTSYFFGGPTSGGLGFGDQYGEFAGFVHKKEYVVPTIVAQDPWVANLLPAIESIRQDRIKGFASGGPTSSGSMQPSSSGMSTARMEMLMEMMLKELRQKQKNPRAYLVYNDLEEMQEEMETLKSRYTA